MMNEIQEKFSTDDLILIRGFLGDEAVSTISQYMENKVNRYGFKIKGTEEDDISSYSWYADPLIEVILVNSLGAVEEITKKKLYPTYSYNRVYMDNDSLVRHTDRGACEYSVTVNIATEGSLWPMFFKSPKGEECSFRLNPGDAIVYKGCDVEHWRENMESEGVKLNAQLMLHYVDTEGPYAEHKWDKRLKLGLGKPSGWRD
jgi:hypothetical protein